MAFEETISSYTYNFNGLGQRMSVRTSGVAFAGTSNSDWDWAYNVKGEMISGVNIASQDRNRAFHLDDIGNRRWTAIGGAPLDPGNPQTEPQGGVVTHYATNELNQYTQITETNGIAPVYDDDGNLLDDGERLFFWDAENRLIKVKRKSDQAQIAGYIYDHRSRRVGTIAPATASEDGRATAFLYDEWNIIAEYSVSSGTSRLLATNLWGLDLSGSAKWAGGVGGVLARITEGVATHFAYDGNGNVTDLLNVAGLIVGHYDYGPFGEMQGASGIMASANPIRWGTQYVDKATGLSIFPLRVYDPRTGRWLNRDRVGESGGVNLYVYVRNHPAGFIDYLGLLTLEVWTKPTWTNGSPIRSRYGSITFNESFNADCKLKKRHLLGFNEYSLEISLAYRPVVTIQFANNKVWTLGPGDQMYFPITDPVARREYENGTDYSTRWRAIWNHELRHHEVMLDTILMIAEALKGMEKDIQCESDCKKASEEVIRKAKQLWKEGLYRSDQIDAVNDYLKGSMH